MSKDPFADIVNAPDDQFGAFADIVQPQDNRTMPPGRAQDYQNTQPQLMTNAKASGQQLPKVWNATVDGVPVQAALDTQAGAYLFNDANGKPNMLIRKPDGSLGARPVASRAERSGAGLPSPLQGAVTALQGPLFGSLDELTGAVQAGKAMLTGEDSKKAYVENRDLIRGMTDQYKRDYPVLSAVAPAAASAPVMALAPGARLGGMAQRVGEGVLTNTTRAAATGAGYGGLTALGESKGATARDVAGDVVQGAGSSALGSAATVPVLNVLGAVGGAVRRGVTGGGAADYARLKVAEAAARDVPEGSVFTGTQQITHGGGINAAGQAIPGVTTTIPASSSWVDRAKARMAKLGPSAMIADTGAANTRNLLDVVVEQPGTTMPKFAREMRQRTAERGGNIISAADEAMGTRNADLVRSVEAYSAKRAADAAPLYAQLNGVDVRVDNQLRGILQRASPYLAESEKLATIQGNTGNRLIDAAMNNTAIGANGLQTTIGSVPFSKLDTLKQTLYDAATSLKKSGEAGKARAIDDLRTALIAKLDDASPKDNLGRSVYQLARNAWAGPSQAIEAADLGRRALSEKSLDLREAVAGLSPSEVDAFRIGALQALREKAGKQSGQTELLAFWKNPATAERLNTIFGGDYRKFAAALMREEQLKQLQSVGAGSATFRRLAASDDMGADAMKDVKDIASSVSSGSIMSAMAAAKNLYKRTSTPEPVRNEIGRILMLKGPEAIRELDNLAQHLSQVQTARSRTATALGVGIGGTTGRAASSRQSALESDNGQ